MLRARPLLSHGSVCKGTQCQCLEPNPYWAMAVTEPWLAMACKSHWLEWVGEGHTLPGKDANTSRAHSFSGLARLLTHCLSEMPVHQGHTLSVDWPGYSLIAEWTGTVEGCGLPVSRAASVRTSPMIFWANGKKVATPCGPQQQSKRLVDSKQNFHS